MLIDEAVTVAAYDLPDVRRLSKSDQIKFLKQAILQLFERTKNKSYKFRVGPFPVSIKIAKLKPLIDWWLNSNGDESVVVG